MSWLEEAKRLSALPPQNEPRIIVTGTETTPNDQGTIYRGAFQRGSARAETESQPTNDERLGSIAGAPGAEKAPRIIAAPICNQTTSEDDFIDFIDFDAIDALREANKLPLPDDSEPRPGLRPLTQDEKRQIRTAGTPMPKGVSFGQTATGQWRRLT